VPLRGAGKTFASMLACAEHLELTAAPRIRGRSGSALRPSLYVLPGWNGQKEEPRGRLPSPCAPR
jgi:hypothetical protein